MRTTDGKPTLDIHRSGEPELSEALAHALGHQGRVDRWTHGFHTYPAGLHPDAARDLLALFPGQRVHDPFCGGGTVLVEAMVDGREVSGADVSVVARLVATTRTRITDDATRTQVRSLARKLTARARAEPVDAPPAIAEQLGDWYDPDALRELTALRQGLAAADVEEPARSLLWGTLSSILVKASHQRSDTSLVRERRPRPAGTTAVLFHKKARELGRRLEAFAEAAAPGVDAPAVEDHDAREPWSRGDLDLILTSPPYPSVYDYLNIQWMREVWLGRAVPREAEIGARRAWRDDPEQAEARWRADHGAWIARAAGALAPGGHLVVVVGDGLTPHGPVPTLAPTRAAAEAVGLAFRAAATLARPDHARETTRDEHVVVFKMNEDLPKSGSDTPRAPRG